MDESLLPITGSNRMSITRLGTAQATITYSGDPNASYTLQQSGNLLNWNTWFFDGVANEWHDSTNRFCGCRAALLSCRGPIQMALFRNVENLPVHRCWFKFIFAP